MIDINNVEDEDPEGGGKSPHLDWKKNKKGFDDSERMTLRIDAQEAMKYQAEKGKAKIGELTPALKKLRKQVRDSYDEVDEGGIDDEVILALQQLQINVVDASNGDNTLLNALSPNERRQIDQRTNLEISRHEQNAGKLNALLQSERLSREAGLSKMSASDFANKMQDAIYNPRRVKLQALEKNISKKIGIKGEINKKNVNKVVRGVKEIKETSENKKVKNISTKDAKIVGKKNTSKNATAEMILRKSGQTARLTEIKMKKTSPEQIKDGENVKRSYSKEMKELLKESLRKNDKVR